MTEIITAFDSAEHLATDSDIQDFLRETAENGRPSDFIHALNTAAHAKRMTEVANKLEWLGLASTNH